MSDRVIYPLGAESPEDTFVTGYMCMTDFECEIGAASSGNVVYPCVETLRKARPCVDGCGIVEVEVRFRRVVCEGVDPL